jgi:3-hydroxyisobutyrate dehydrogenase-like beta-hydroxyacid dehydrogenase
MRVGFMGPGLMGHGAAKHILLKGYPLAVLGHRNRVPVDDLVARGAVEVADLPALAAASDVIVLFLPGVAEVEATVTALLPLVRPGMVVLDASTGLPETTRRLGALLAERGAAMVDGPVGRTPKEAAEGKLSSMLGGDPAVIARIRPIVDCYADTVISCGALGTALTVKLVNNFVSFSNAMIIGETFAAASKLGVDLDALAAVIEAGGSNSVMFSWIAPWIRSGDDSRGRGKLWMGQNVLETYRAIARDAGAPTEMADAVSRVVGGVVDAGHGERFLPTLPGILALMAGAPFRNLDGSDVAEDQRRQYPAGRSR